MESIQSKLSVGAMSAYFGIFKGEFGVSHCDHNRSIETETIHVLSRFQFEME
jgi:hypothetical protein